MTLNNFLLENYIILIYREINVNDKEIYNVEITKIKINCEKNYIKYERDKNKNRATKNDTKNNIICTRLVVIIKRVVF